MADDKTKRGSPDNKRLNKSEPYEVAYAKSKRAKAAAAKTAKKSAKSASQDVGEAGDGHGIARPRRRRGPSRRRRR